MKIEIDLAKRIEFDDYHKFDILQKGLNLLDSRIRTTEIDYDPKSGKYIGIVYFAGTLDSEDVSKLVDDIHIECSV